MPVVYRVAKKRHPIYDTTGAVRVGGRWTSPGHRVVYTAEHYATALLEVLVHHGRVALPGSYHGAALFLPEALAIEQFNPAEHPGWDRPGSAVARAVGDAWVASGRTAVLRVPSVPGQPVEWNLVLNPAHPDAGAIQLLPAFDITWDGRLFGPPPGTVQLGPA